MRRVCSVLIMILCLFSILPSNIFANTNLEATFEPSTLSLENSIKYNQDFVVEHITFTTDSGGGRYGVAYYDLGKSLRFYSKNSLTIKPDKGFVIRSIHITTAGKGNTLTEENAAIQNASTDGLGTTSITLTPTNGTNPIILSYIASTDHWRIQKITVTYAAIGSCEHSSTKCVSVDHLYHDLVCEDCGQVLNSNLEHSFTNFLCICGAVDDCQITSNTNPTTGLGYKLGIELPDSKHFFLGRLDGFYLATSDLAPTGTDVYMEAVDGGYHLYFLDTKNKKSYISIVTDGTYITLQLGDTAEPSIYTWDETYQTPVTMVGNRKYFLGSLGSYDTISPLKYEYIDTSYPCHIYTLSPANTCAHPADQKLIRCDNYSHWTICGLCGKNKSSTCTHTYENHICTFCRYIDQPTDIADILSCAYSLDDGEAMPHPVELTGTISNIITAYDPQFKNVSVQIFIAGYEGFPIQCINMNAGDASITNLMVGDTITVSGILSNQSGQVVFYSSCVCNDHTTHKHNNHGATCCTPGQCTICGGVGTIDPTAHSYTNYISDQNATCTENGTKTAKCDRCGRTDTIVEEGTAGHVDENIDKRCDRCLISLCIECSDSEDDNDHNCDTCGQRLGGHNYTANITESTCVAAGFTTYACNCGECYTEPIPATAHTLVKIAAVAPTTESSGMREHYQCTVCSKRFADAAGQKEISLNDLIVGKLPPASQYDHIQLILKDLGIINGDPFIATTLHPITFTASIGDNDHGNLPRYYVTGSALRVYSKNTLTISASYGYRLRSITIVTGKDNKMTSENTGITGGYAVGLDTTTVVITPISGDDQVVLTYLADTGHWRIESITVEYDGEPADPPAPTEPTNPTEPTSPAEPTVPTDPTAPTEPNDSTEDTSPAEPTDPIQDTIPNDPTETTAPVDPTIPSDPAAPTEPSVSTHSTDPTETNPQIMPSKHDELGSMVVFAAILLLATTAIVIIGIQKQTK